MRGLSNEEFNVRALASAVIMRAILDSKGIGVKCGESHKSNKHITIGSAKRFLRGGAILKAWCFLAEIDYKQVIKGDINETNLSACKRNAVQGV